MKQELENKLVYYCSELNFNINNISILIAISGGVDSIVLSNLLLDLRLKYKFTLSFAHFNHKMHNKANKMQLLCKNFALKNNVKIYNDIISIPHNCNIESYSRNYRYGKLNKIALDNNIQFILTAHHYDDQVETLFMKHIDNADWISCIGIREKYGLIRRPLIGIRKENLINYAKYNNLNWIEDPSNKKLNFRRNTVRRVLLPEAKSENVGLENLLINKSIIYSSKIKNILKKLNDNKDNIIIKSNKYFYIVNLKEICNYEVESLKIFIYWLSSEFLNTHIGIYNRSFWLNFKNYLSTANTGTHYSIGEVTFLLNRDQVYVTKLYDKLLGSPSKIRLTKKSIWYNSLLRIHDHRESIMESSNIKFFPKEIINEGVYIRRWKKGDKVLTESLNEKLVSDLFIKNKISIMSKLIYPIIVDKYDAIIWIPGLIFSSGKYKNLKQNEIKQVEWIQT